MSIKEFEIIRPGAECATRHKAELARRYIAMSADSATYGPGSDEARGSSRAFREWKANYIVERYPVQHPVHIVRSAVLDSEEQYALELFTNTHSPYHSKFVCKWKYEPPSYESTYPKAARVTGLSYEGNTRFEYRLEFTWFVNACKTTIRHLPYIKKSMTPVKTQVTETEEWHYDIVATADQQIELNKLIVERNDMGRENGYGGDSDLNPIQHDIHLLCATLG